MSEFTYYPEQAYKDGLIVQEESEVLSACLHDFHQEIYLQVDSKSGLAEFTAKVEIQDLEELNTLVKWGWDCDDLYFVSSDLLPRISTTLHKEVTAPEGILKSALLGWMGIEDMGGKLKTSPQRIHGRIHVSLKDITGEELQELLNRDFMIGSVQHVPGEKALIVYASKALEE